MRRRIYLCHVIDIATLEQRVRKRDQRRVWIKRSLDRRACTDDAIRRLRNSQFAIRN